MKRSALKAWLIPLLLPLATILRVVRFWQRPAANSRFNLERVLAFELQGAESDR